MNSCQLCHAQVLTPRVHEDGICWVADCIVCRVPMVVSKEHNPAPSDEARRHMLDVLISVALPRFSVRWRIDTQMRRIPDHFHAHARPLDPRTAA